MRAKHLYLGLCVVGTILPLASFLPFLRSHGPDLNEFLQQLFGTPVGSFFGWDVIVSSAVLWTFVLHEGRRLRMSRLWAPIAANLLVGVSLGLPLMRLDEASLLAEASRKTGLDDFGDARFREPLRLLLDSLEREAHLTTLGRMIARRDVLRLLENRLRMESVHRAHPEIAAAPVPAPLFVVGLPRTGTSILHELLAQDPQSRVPMSWEVQHPWPPPELATFDTDPRIADVETHLAGVDRILPDFKKIHPMGARLPGRSSGCG